jgi:predicted restriction endonuclease
MMFDSAKLLRKATSRAKSDVANKLVGMFLHELSRKVSSEIGMRVSDPSYHRAVVETFGHQCAYCERTLETDRAAVEHLDGMNRFRVGLHIVGNVLVSCKRCNNQKRNDDSRT